MPKKLTTEEFIEKARKVHGDKYDYSKVEYVNAFQKVYIICPEHGGFWQRPGEHLSGRGCRKCHFKNIGELLSISKEEFIKRAREVHGDKYIYEKVKYVNFSEKVCIICPEHGEFWQSPRNHLNGQNCPICMGIHKYTYEEFIEKAKMLHGDKYDYSKVNFINTYTKVCIICPEHGEFWQTPKNHLKGAGCVKCGIINASKKRRSNTDEFIKRAKEIHGDEYDYSMVNYINNHTKVEIICHKHGSFFITPNCHLNGQKCPKCNHSNGELKIEEYLKNNNIKYEAQYSVKLQELMFSRNNLKVDFYLPEYNTFVEFNRIQHYKRIPYFHKSEDDFQMQVERDKRLKNYCKKNKIKLIVIKYNQINKIEKILNQELTK